MQMSAARALEMWQAFKEWRQQRINDVDRARYNLGYMHVLREYFIMKHPLDYIIDGRRYDYDQYDIGVQAAVEDLYMQLKCPRDTDKGYD